MTSPLIITGATGFVGRHLLSYAKSAHLKVLPVVRSRERGSFLTQNNFLVFDEMTGARLESLGFSGSCIVHLIGPSGHEHSQSIWNSIVGTTESVVAAAKEANCKRIVYLSGFGVTAQTTNTFFKAKTEAENIIRSSNVPYSIFRCSYILGDGDELTPSIVEALRKGQVEIPGDGSYRIQPLYIGDVVQVIVNAAEQPTSESSTIDLLGEPISYQQFVALLASRIRPEAKIIPVAIEDFIRRALFSSNPDFDVDELAILVCDKVGRPTGTCFGVDLTSVEKLIARICANY